jgi:DNA-directed RNA polymerase
LNACLASGDINRAEDVAKRIKANWSKLGEVGSLSTLLPCRVHADFLKAYLVRALQPFLQENVKTTLTGQTITSTLEGGKDGEAKKGYEGLGLPSLSDQRDLPNHSALSMRSNVQSSRNISKAWAYFDSLYGPQWDVFDPATRRIRRGVNGAIDAGVFAAMFKGLVKLGSDVYNPSSLTDPDRVFRPITYLLPAMRRAKVDLETVMKDSIFDVDLPSYLGKLERERVLDALQETGRGREGWDEWERIVDEVRAVLARIREGREKEEMEKPQVPELDPVMANVSDAKLLRISPSKLMVSMFCRDSGRSSQRLTSNPPDEPLDSRSAYNRNRNDSHESTTPTRRIFLRRSSPTLPPRNGISRKSR